MEEHLAHEEPSSDAKWRTLVMHVCIKYLLHGYL